MGTICAKWWEAVCSTFTLIRAPSAERRAPSAERRAPSAERRAPSAERRGHDCASGAGATPPAIAA